MGMYKFYFLLINTLINLNIENDITHIIDKAHGIIDIIKYIGDISIIILLLLSLSSITSDTFIYK